VTLISQNILSASSASEQSLIRFVIIQM